jgi:pyruvyltransferase
MTIFLSLLFLFFGFTLNASEEHLVGLPLYHYQFKQFTNFGDHLSLKIVERMVGGEVRVCPHTQKNKLLALGSILIFAKNGVVIWGTGMNAKRLALDLYKFDKLDIRAVRGPLTRRFIMENFNIDCPEIYGDPALLMPYLFPEFKKIDNPKDDYLIIPHYSEIELFPKSVYSNVVYPTEPWNVVVRRILNSRFVISSSLHGVIVAEAYGIPARYLRLTENEPLFKYTDYYAGTNRPDFKYATSVEDALIMGAEPPFDCDLKKLYESFPFEYWPNETFRLEIP